MCSSVFLRNFRKEIKGWLLHYNVTEIILYFGDQWELISDIQADFPHIYSPIKWGFRNICVQT